MRSEVTADSSDQAAFIGGPYDQAKARLVRCPPSVKIADVYYYERIDDPDTGEYLGGYVYRGIADDA